MATLSALPYKGTRDFYPEDKRIQNYIFNTWRTAVELHGYQEYGAPMLEPLEVYTAKSGQELASEQTYSFVDRGDRVVAIRPEMTPSISRMVAARRQELAYPARLYSIANFMRYERPQRGREREFWQLNADVFGVDTAAADAEIISLAYEIMKAFGAKDDMFTIRINDRKLIDFMMSSYLELDAVGAQMMVKLFDRRNKISEEEFTQQAIEILSENAESGITKINKLLRVTTVGDLPTEMLQSTAAEDVRQLTVMLDKLGVKNLQFDITLMRGLDYYTGTVFEVFDLHPDNNRSMFGGGRYDGLVGLFGAEPVPTVGMAPGLSTTELFLRTHNLLPELPPTTEIGIVVIDGDSMDGALALAKRFREEGVNVEVDISGRKLDKQIKSVLKKQLPFIVFVGETEIKDDRYNIKDTVTMQEENLSPERIVSKVKDQRRPKVADDELFI
jgi:histidyl-tRNA synthetase